MARPSLFLHIKTHVFRGRAFRIFWKRPPRNKKLAKGSEYHGDCRLKPARIRVHPDEDQEELMFTVLHESLHACCFDIDNDVVDDWECDVKRLLRRMGLKVTFEPKP